MCSDLNLKTMIMRAYFFSLLALMSVFVSCGQKSEAGEDGNLVSKFNSTWNVYEKYVSNDDGSVTYLAMPWGGLVGSFLKQNMPVDWSEYESICFEFAEPTTVATQVLVSDRVRTWGKPGITSLTCNFDGQDVHSVSEVVLQAADSCSITVKRITLKATDGVWESRNIWKGSCSFGNWTAGFSVKSDKFENIHEGDKLEIVFNTDQSNPDIGYWLMKTIYSGTENTLEGNFNEINEWGCALMGKKSTVYRIALTANDVEQLQLHGLFVNGFYLNVSRCNLLSKGI